MQVGNPTNNRLQDEDISTTDKRKTLARINPEKAGGADNIQARALKVCVNVLAAVTNDIF